MKPIVHPEWLPDALDSLRKTIDLRDRNLMPSNIEGWMFSTPIHYTLRAIHGGYWAVVWWALGRAVEHVKYRWTPLWWLEWRERRAWMLDRAEVGWDVDETDDEDERP